MLIKYRDVEIVGENDCVKIIEHDNPVVVIQTIKQIDSIMINDEWYEYVSSEYIPARTRECVDVLNIYVCKI